MNEQELNPKALPKTNSTGIPQRLQHLRQVADRAAARFENEAAVALYTRALQALPRKRNRQLDALECDLLYGRADCYRRLGDTAAYSNDLDAMAQLARQSGDALRLVAALTIRAQTPKFDTMATESAAREAVEIAQTAGEPVLLARALTALGSTAWNNGDFSRATELAERALSLCREVGDRPRRDVVRR